MELVFDDLSSLDTHIFEYLQIRGAKASFQTHKFQLKIPSASIEKMECIIIKIPVLFAKSVAFLSCVWADQTVTESQVAWHSV